MGRDFRHIAGKLEDSTPATPPKLTPRDEQRVEDLFTQARADRSRAYELKQELDRLDVFRDYEDRFLDLFQKPES